MMQRSVIEQAIADFGSECMVGLARDGSDAVPVRMVIRQEGEGAINSRSSLRRFADISAQRPGASFAYGLILAEDTPEGMRSDTEVHVTDSLGQEWTSDASQAVTDVDEAGKLVRVGWRMLLHSKQRMVRGL